jgi:hypothetical protein
MEHEDQHDREQSSEAGAASSVAAMCESTATVARPEPDTPRDWSMPEFHPITGLFPMMTDKELEALTADVAAHCLREPIVIHSDGRVLDGRARIIGCERAGVTPAFCTYDGPDPMGYVISKNLHRRHLSESQRAMVAARIANLKVGRPVAEDKNSANLQNSRAISLRHAAARLGVSERSAGTARALLDRGAAELVQAVDDGVLTVGAAERISRLPADQQANRTREKLAKKHVDADDNKLAEPMDLARKMLITVGVNLAEQPDLRQPWEGNILLHLPRAHRMAKLLVDKLLEERHAGRARQAIVFLKCRTSAPWFQEAVAKCAAICLTRDQEFGRNGCETRSPATGFALLYFGGRHDEFTRVFRPVGVVLLPATEYESALAKLRDITPLSSVPPGGHHVH